MKMKACILILLFVLCICAGATAQVTPLPEPVQNSIATFSIGK